MRDTKLIHTTINRSKDAHLCGYGLHTLRITATMTTKMPIALEKYQCRHELPVYAPSPTKPQAPQVISTIKRKRRPTGHLAPLNRRPRRQFQGSRQGPCPARPPDSHPAPQQRPKALTAKPLSQQRHIRGSVAATAEEKVPNVCRDSRFSVCV